jgi:hypothetical protein
MLVVNVDNFGRLMLDFLIVINEIIALCAAVLQTIANKESEISSYIGLLVL